MFSTDDEENMEHMQCNPHAEGSLNGGGGRMEKGKQENRIISIIHAKQGLSTPHQHSNPTGVLSCTILWQHNQAIGIF